MKSLTETAMLETISDLIEEMESSGQKLDSMSTFMFNMQNMTVLAAYNAKLRDLGGDFEGILAAIENGNYSDENGGLLTDSLTFQQLKKRLGQGE